jgi:predicted O-linked N-acetylglucosamine transferase (SPINDLY family)
MRWESPPMANAAIFHNTHDKQPYPYVMPGKQHTQSLWLHAQQLLKGNQIDQARQVIRQICANEPDNPQAWLLLGQTEGQCSDYVAAEKSFRKASALSPRHAAAHYGVGCSLLAQQRFSEAAGSFKSALEIKPDYLEALGDYGYALQAAGQLPEAAAVYTRALQLSPQNFTARYNLAVVLKDQGLHAQAETHFRTALTLKPGSVEAHNSLGYVLKEQGRLEEAEQSLRHALAGNPNFADAHHNLGCVLESMLQLHAAETCFRTALQLKPGLTDALSHLGNVLLAQGAIDEALACYRKAVDDRPEHAPTHSNLLMALHYHESLSPQQLFEEHLKWGARVEQPGARHVRFSNSPDPLRRLRVGYVSPDFCIHSVANFLLPLLANHDPEAVDMVCYSNTERQDEITARFQAQAGTWRDIRNKSDEEVVQGIREDRIDILVDLAGHTGRSRLRVFGYKAAPVQLTYLGYPDTTGLKTVDYRLTDQWADPPGQEAFHTEKLIRLPGGFLCYSPLFETPPVSPAPLLDKGFITFGSFNNAMKVNPDVLRLWAEILKTVPRSRLLLKTKSFWDKSVAEDFSNRLQTFGVARERVELRPWALHPRNHLVHYREVDIALDTFPYNGTTTTCEALWMGVPVITLAGRTHAGRVGVSLLSALGLENLIAPTTDEYLALAVALAQDTARLTALRSILRDRMAQSSLCNGQKFASEVERVYRSIWRDWCATARG